MALTKKQFEVLQILEEAKSCIVTKELERKTGYSFEEIVELINDLEKLGYIEDGIITKNGTDALEPYRVKRAIFMAAGFGSRLVPITLNTPKPLVRVNGSRIIDTVLDACVAAGIEEIVVIRGYLAEQFDQLLYKYPNITFVNNSMYNEANNISSIVCVRDLLQNAYVIEADLVLNNPELIKKYQYKSNTLGIKVDDSEDWCFVVKNEVIVKQVPNGNAYKENMKPGEELYQEIGISYLSGEDGKKLAYHTEEVFSKLEGRGRYWDQVQFLDYGDQYRIDVRPCKEADIVEIDTYQELVAIDNRYAIS